MSWLQITGKEDLALEQSLQETVKSKLEQKNFTDKDLEYIRKLDRTPRLKSDSGQLDPDLFVMLRQLCSLCDAKPVAQKITSHRPLVGPVIVAGKKILYSLFSAVLKSREEQQRKFNSTALEIMLKLAESKSVK